MISTVTRDDASTWAPTWLATSEIKSLSVRDEAIEVANSESKEEPVSAKERTTSKLAVHEYVAKSSRRCRNDVCVKRRFGDEVIAKSRRFLS